MSTVPVPTRVSQRRRAVIRVKSRKCRRRFSFPILRERESIYGRRAKGFATSSRPSKLDLWPGRSGVGPSVRPAPVITVSQ